MAQIELDIQIDDQPIERLINSLESLTDSVTDLSNGFVSAQKNIDKETKTTTKSVREQNEAIKDTNKEGKNLNGFTKVLKGIQEGFLKSSIATKGFAVALKATGIGIVVVLVSKLIDAFMQFANQLVIVQMYMEILEKVMTAVTNVMNKLTNLIFKQRAATDELIASNIELANQSEKTNKERTIYLESELELLKAQGADTEQIRAAEMKLAIERAEYAQKNLKLMQEEIVYLESIGKLSKEQKARLEELNNSISDIQNEAIKSTKAIDILIAKQQGQRENERKAIDEQKNSDIKASQEVQKRKEEAHKQYLNNRLTADRLQEDLDLQLMENGIDKEIKLNEVKYDRLIADTLNNEKLLQEEKDVLIKQYEDLRDNESKRINDKKEEEERIAMYEKSIRLGELERELEQNRISSLEEYSEERNQRELELAEEEFESKMERLRYELEQGLITKEEFDLLETINKEEHEQELLDIDKKYSDKKIEIAKKEAEEKKALQQAVTQAGISAAYNLLGAMSDLAEEGSKEAKALGIAQVTIDTIMGGIAAVTQSIAQLGPIAGPIVGGVLAAGIAASGASAIQKIKNTSKDNSNGSVSNIRVATPTNNTTPNFDLYPSNNDNNVYSNDNVTTNQQSTEQQPIRAVVSWTDIDAVSKSDNQLRNQMSL